MNRFSSITVLVLLALRRCEPISERALILEISRCTEPTCATIYPRDFSLQRRPQRLPQSTCATPSRA
jgi:hypothetical protein